MNWPRDFPKYKYEVAKKDQMIHENGLVSNTEHPTEQYSDRILLSGVKRPGQTTTHVQVFEISGIKS